MDHSLEAQPRSETETIETAKQLFQSALLSEPMDASQDGEGNYPSWEDALGADSEAQLLDANNRLFRLISKLTSPGQRIRMSAKRNTHNPGDESVYATYALGPEPRRFPYDQLWVTNFAPNTGIEPTDEKYMKRFDVDRRGKVNSLLDSLYSANVDDAANHRQRVIREVVRLCKKPIDSTTVLLQSVTGRGIFASMLGFRVNQYLTGFQVFPVIPHGRSLAGLYDRPVIAGEAANISWARPGEIANMPETVDANDTNLVHFLNIITTLNAVADGQR